MEVITYSDARNHLNEVIESLVENQDTALIKRTGDKENVVIMTEKHYHNLIETAFLLENAENAEKLLKSMDEYQSQQTAK